MSADQPIPLSFVRAGSFVEITSVIGGCDEVKRLSEMGLRDGTQLELVQSGSPCVLRLGQTKLCFRQADVLNILVKPVAQENL